MTPGLTRRHRIAGSSGSVRYTVDLGLGSLIDLHSHTNESDGTCSPADLIQEALRAGVHILGITDHDTLAGYDQAVPLAQTAGLGLVCGIELSTKLHGRSVHLLGYFLTGNGLKEFRAWVLDAQSARRDRNIRLVARLQELGFDITLEEAEARGRGLTGRPHFARILVEKGYARDSEHAFREYLGETAPSYVERDSPPLPEAAQHVLAAGGIPVIAHPIRLGIRKHGEEARLIEEMRDAGLRGIEAYHSDHSAADTARYLALADTLGMAISGGSDFHGAAKPRIFLGTGHDGALHVPGAVLEGLRRLVAQA